MFTLSKLSSTTGDIGKPLPVQYATWEANKVLFRTGATSMIAAVPGSFKSVLALNMAAWWATQGLSALYFSADSDLNTVKGRVAGVLTGDSPELVEARLTNDKRYYDRRLNDVADFKVDDHQRSIEGVQDHVRAFEAVYGAYPDVVFLDNLVDFVDNPDNYGDMLVVIREMDAMARQTKSHVCILHHAKIRTDEKRDGWPPANHEIQGKVTQFSRLVLTIEAQKRQLYWACVKNTLGPQDPKARTRYGFYVEESMRIRDTGYRGSE